MSAYATEQELKDGLDTKIDKSSIDIDKLTNDSTRVASTKLITQKLAEIEYPTNLEKCLKEFDNMYLGYKDTPPTRDINGKALSTGLMYWNTIDKMLYIYDGSVWVKSVSDNPTVLPTSPNIIKYDVEMTTETTTVTIPNGYDPNTLSVYLNGVRMTDDDYEATDGVTIEFTDPVSAGDVISGFYSSDEVLKNFDVEATSTTRTITIPSGYNPKTVSVYLNGIRMSVQDYTASNGTDIEFTDPIDDGDVVSGFYVEDYDNLVSIVQEYDRIEDAPTPSKNGSLAWDLTRGQLFYYSATLGKWISRTGVTGDIGFYDSSDEFEDPTVASTDKLYVDRSKKAFYLFDGSKYIPYGTWYGEYLPSIKDGAKGVLYYEEDSETLYVFNGVRYVEVSDPNKEWIQDKQDKSDFIYTGSQKLFLAKSSNRLYSWNGNEFIPINNVGVGENQFVEDDSGLTEKEEVLFVDKSNGKTYYYDDDKWKRANKEIWRIASDSDLNGAIKDEDFVYLIDDTNILKKYDKELDTFETLGTPKVTHKFAKESDIDHTDPTPSRQEVEDYVADRNFTDCILWGNLTDDKDVKATWGYSIDSEGKAVIVYQTEDKTVVGFCVVDGEQTFDGTLEIRVENGLVELKDGGGNTINIKETNSNGNLIDGSNILEAFYNGQKFPKVDLNQSGNYASIDTDRIINERILYDGDFIEVQK